MCRTFIHLYLYHYSSRNRENTRPLELPASVGSTSHTKSRHDSEASSMETYETNATSLPALQQRGPPDENDALEPLLEDDPASYDLVMPAEERSLAYSLEKRSELLFSTVHLEVIFADPILLSRFTAFLSVQRPQSMPILIYYLDATKALKAINYSNAIADALQHLAVYEFTVSPVTPTAHPDLRRRS